MSNKKDKFIKIANPDENGFSDEIMIEKLPQDLKDNNGKAWSRESDLGKDFYMVKKYERGTVDTRKEKQKSSGGLGELVSIQLVGKK
ncbi:MAG: hypothetical protein IJ211_04885 [Campylobacter sp.]|nr:hypothetical protein [Campylobacter sp.]